MGKDNQNNADATNSAYIYGAAVSASWADASLSLTDLIFEGVTAALKDAGMSISAADSIVLSAHDLIDGRSLSSMVTAPAAGAYLRDEIRLSEDGLAAMSLAAARVEAGESEVSVVAAWGRASEGDFLATSRVAMDPFTQQPLGMSEMDISAFRLSRWMTKHGVATPARAAALQAQKKRAKTNPNALSAQSVAHPVSFPVHADEGPKWADVVVAVIIGKKPSGVRVTGVGHSTDMTQVGDRDLLAMPALRDAAKSALSDADLDLKDISIFEVDGMTLSDEAIAIEALGLCSAGEGFKSVSQDSRINLSGGSQAGWCYPAMGLVRLSEAYLRMRDKSKEPTGERKFALVTGQGAGGGQTSTAIILEAK